VGRAQSNAIAGSVALHIVSDLEHQAELPSDVVLRVDVADEDAVTIGCVGLIAWVVS
jgi:hypothetical protein